MSSIVIYMIHIIIYMFELTHLFERMFIFSVTHEGKSYRTSPYKKQLLFSNVMSLQSVVIIIMVKAAAIHLLGSSLHFYYIGNIFLSRCVLEFHE